MKERSRSNFELQTTTNTYHVQIIMTTANRNYKRTENIDHNYIPLSQGITSMSRLCIFILALVPCVSHAHIHPNHISTRNFPATANQATSSSTTGSSLPSSSSSSQRHRSNNHMKFSFSHAFHIDRGGDQDNHEINALEKKTEKEKRRKEEHTTTTTTTEEHVASFQEDNCYRYAKIAILNLSNNGTLAPSRQEYKIQPMQEEDGGESTLVSSFVMEKWMKPQWEKILVGSRDDRRRGEDGNDDDVIQRGKLLAIPSRFLSEDLEFLEGSFVVSSSELEKEQDYEDGDKGLGDIVETIGCLVDCIVIFYDTSFSARQSCIVRLIKGIERQRNSGFLQEKSERGSDDNDDDEQKMKQNKIGNKENISCNRIQIIMLAMDPAAHEELIAIKDVIEEGDEELGNMIRIVPLESHQGHQEVMRQVLLDTVEHATKVNAAVPMKFFPNLAKRVYSRVGWATTHQKKNNNNKARADIVFETRRLGVKEKKQQEKGPAVRERSSDEVFPKKELKGIVEQSIEKFSIQIDEKIDQLEMKQDEVMMDETKMPILEFGRDAANILSLASNVLSSREIQKLVRGAVESDYIERRRSHFLSTVNDKVRRLFENQINSLREYYGRKYETVIEKLQDAMISDTYNLDKEQMTQRRMKFDKLLVEEAKRSTEGFRAAAENAIPAIVKNGDLKNLGMGYVYDTALDGLIRDMMKATSDSQSLEDEWESLKTDDNDESDGAAMKKPRGPLKWYEKLAARALVFGVNYLQGWLAYQGIKKAAAERDRMMPKFPLF
jgi:hypothetical protein